MLRTLEYPNGFQTKVFKDRAKGEGEVSSMCDHNVYSSSPTWVGGEGPSS